MTLLKSTPNTTLIDRARTGNSFFGEGEPFQMNLTTTTSEKDNTFIISLDAERKRDGVSLRLETRIAIEQHKFGEGHQFPHLQINNLDAAEELLKTGMLRITLLVENQSQLDACCNGFVFYLSELLDIIEDFLGENLGLKEFFFNLKPLEDLKPFKEDLQELVYKSFKVHILKTKDHELKLVEYKGKKSEEELDITNNFKVLSKILGTKLLSPLLLNPLVRLILEDGNIKKECPKLDPVTCETKLLKKTNDELVHYSRDQFIKDFKPQLKH